MNETAPSRRKSLWWAWFVVPPVVLLTIFCVLFASHFRREAIIRRLEGHGAKVLFSTYGSFHSLMNVPGLKNYRVPIKWVSIAIDRKSESNFPELLVDARELGGNLNVDLSGSQNLTRDLVYLPRDHVAERVIDVEISGLVITGSDLQSLEQVRDLRGLVLVGCQFDEETALQFGNLTQLIRLNIDNSSISDAGIRHLSGLANLKHLSLSNTQVSDAAKAELSAVRPELELSDD